MILETDLGHDPDDFLAICYLAAKGVKIEAMCLVPGHLDQLALANFFKKELFPELKIATSNESCNSKSCLTGFHKKILNRFGYPLAEKVHSTLGKDVIAQCQSDEVLIIGPAKSVGDYLLGEPNPKFKKLVMQGGFLPYDRYRPKICLDKFEGKEYVGTYNLNGTGLDRANRLIDCKILEKRFVGKNICHTVEIGSIPRMWGENRAAEIYNEGVALLDKGKAIHDVLAAACYLNPDLGVWVRGRPTKVIGGWTTYRCGDDGPLVLADFSYLNFWASI